MGKKQILPDDDGFDDFDLDDDLDPSHDFGKSQLSEQKQTPQPEGQTDGAEKKRKRPKHRRGK